MATLSIKVDIDGPRQAIENLRAEQLPFTIARALTMTAQGGQTVAREEEAIVFKLRNDWTMRNTKIKAATKQELIAQVYTDTANRSTGAPDYLPGQQSGREKVPVNGRQHIAIPTKYLTKMVGYGIIPQELRPKALLQYAQNGGKRLTRGGKLRGQSAAIRGMIFFGPVRLSSGAYAIMGRYVTDREAYPMYLLVDEVRVRAIFPMEETVTKRAQDTFPENFKKAAAETMANDMLRGSGIQVKL